jgi:hypothetical protein
MGKGDVATKAMDGIARTFKKATEKINSSRVLKDARVQPKDLVTMHRNMVQYALQHSQRERFQENQRADARAKRKQDANHQTQNYDQRNAHQTQNHDQRDTHLGRTLLDKQKDRDLRDTHLGRTLLDKQKDRDLRDTHLGRTLLDKQKDRDLRDTHLGRTLLDKQKDRDLRNTHHGEILRDKQSDRDQRRTFHRDTLKVAKKQATSNESRAASAKKQVVEAKRHNLEVERQGRERLAFDERKFRVQMIMSAVNTILGAAGSAIGGHVQAAETVRHGL